VKSITLFNPNVGGTIYDRPPYFRTKKLALIGCTTNNLYAPWHDPSWTIASHCSARKFCQREPDWYFDMHRPECFRDNGKGWHPEYYTWLKKVQTPIFMQERWKDVPMSVRYPIERILQEFRAYFTNHVAYMIALAMTEGVKTVGLFGCQYGAHTEYSTQRGSVEYWLGRFEQYGGEVVLPVKHNTVLAYPSTLYGYESHDAKGKLTGDYTPRKPVVTKATSKGQEVLPLTVESASAPEPHKPLPTGEGVAWGRRDALFGRA
jgi:hypothetical protein